MVNDRARDAPGGSSTPSGSVLDASRLAWNMTLYSYPIDPASVDVEVQRVRLPYRVRVLADLLPPDGVRDSREDRAHGGRV